MKISIARMIANVAARGRALGNRFAWWSRWFPPAGSPSRPPTIPRSTPPAQRWSRPCTLGKHQANWTKTVQPTEGRYRPREEPVTCVVPTEIGSQRVHLTAGLRHLASRRLDARLRARRDTDPTILGQQRLGNSPAEPSAGGGDQGTLALQAQLHDPMLKPRPRQMPPFTTLRDTALCCDWAQPVVQCTLPCGTAGSQLNSYSPLAPKYQWPARGRHSGTLPVRLTSTATSSTFAMIL
jgi:hypothetical protein